ncbi:MAG: phosphate ABC transporter substrate-binding protein [Deltaproteobacteria bacterium]|nr:MAG: phosphate ABC transporter substrate-binding protein [Deltaproteobacteria bacterium]
MKKSLWLKVLALSMVLCFGIAGSAFAEKLVIKGSTTVLPVAQKAAEDYMKMHPDVIISISGGGSGKGIKALVDGFTDIANASRFIKKKEINHAMKNNIFPVAHRVAIDAIVPVVHPTNRIKNLTLPQLKSIYQAKIRNWKELGGDDRKIVIISRDTGSGTYEVWHKKVMKKERISPRAQLLASNGAVVQAVKGNKHAIGYVGIGYLGRGLKALDVNGVTASVTTALNGTYPVARPLFMFTNGWPKGVVSDFINFMVGPKGQKIVKEEGFVPLYELGR